MVEGGRFVRVDIDDPSATAPGGGRIGICKSCMIHNGFSAEQIVPGYEIITAPEVIDLMMAAKGSLQIT